MYGKEVRNKTGSKADRTYSVNSVITEHKLH